MPLSQGRLTENGFMRGLQAGSNRVREDYVAAVENIGFRTFDGIDDQLLVNVGNLASTSLPPSTWVFAGRFLSHSGDGVIIASDGFTAIDWYRNTSVGIRWYDGSTNSNAFECPVPATTEDCIIVFRFPSSGVMRYSYATHNGTSWSSFTHGNSASDFGTATLPSSGTLKIGGVSGAFLNARIAAMAVYNASLSDAEIEDFTTTLADWDTPTSLVNLWRMDQTPVVDLKGTATQNSINGTTVTADAFPLPVGSFTPPVTVPDAPTSLNAFIDDGAIDLTWTAPVSDGGSAITDYVVQYRTTAGPGSWNTFSDGTSTATLATVTGLTNGTSYDFRVAAVNSVGTGAYSATDTETPADTLLVQSVSGPFSGGSVVLVMPGNVTAGNKIIVNTATYNATPSGCTDSLGNTYSQIGTTINGGGATLRTYACNVTTGGPCTITISGAHSSVASEWEGINTITPLVAANNSGINNSPVGAATGTLNSKNRVVLAAMSHAYPGNANMNADAADGFMEIGEITDNVSYQALHVQYKIPTTTASLTPNWTIDGISGGPFDFATQTFVLEGVPEYVGYRTFGGGEYVDLDIAEMAGVTLDGYTCVALIRPANNSGTYTWWSMVPASGRGSQNIYAYSRNQPFGGIEVDNVSGGNFVDDNDGVLDTPGGKWTIAVFNRTAGSGGQAVRGHINNMTDGGGWLHHPMDEASGTLTQTTSVSSSGRFRIGGDGPGNEDFVGDIAAIGFTNSSLSDANIESLSTGIESWKSLLQHAWRLDQTTVVDLVGNMDQTAIVGTPDIASGGDSPLIV